MEHINKELGDLYKVIVHEQTNKYDGNSALGGFEEYFSVWSDGILNRYDDPRVGKIIADMRMIANSYQTLPLSHRERRIAEIGRMLLSLRDLLPQIPYRRKAVNKPFVSDEAKSHKDIAIEHKQEGRFTEAVAEFEKELEASPDDYFSLSHLAHIYLLQDKLNEANRLIDRSLKLNPNNPFAHGIKGEILFKSGNEDEAAQVFEELLNLKPDDTYAHSKLGVIYRRQGKMKEALATLKRGLEIRSDDPGLHHALGDVYAWLGKDEEALAEYQKAIELDPEDEYAFRGLVSSSAKGRDAKSTISSLQKILKIPSRRQNPHLHALLAQHLKQDKEYEAAAEEFREALRLQPRSIYFQTQLAFCYSKMEQFSKALELLEPLYKLRPKDPIIAEALAKCYTGVGRSGEARRLLIDMLYLYPNDRSLRAALMKIRKI